MIEYVAVGMFSSGRKPPIEIVNGFPRALRPTASAESSDATTPPNIHFFSVGTYPPPSPSGTVSEDQVVYFDRAAPPPWTTHSNTNRYHTR